MCVDIRPGYTSLYDGAGKNFRGKDLGKTATVIGVSRIDHEIVSKIQLAPMLLVSTGQIVRTAPVSLGWHILDGLSIRLLSAAGLVPHYNMDEFVEECFRIGYTKVEIGHRYYASGSFGVTCSYAGSAPRIRDWPAIWGLVDRYGLRYGCGGNHSAQLCEFVPTGKYKFGELTP